MPIAETIAERITELERERAAVKAAADVELAKIDAALALLKQADGALKASPDLAVLYDELAKLNVVPTTRGA